MMIAKYRVDKLHDDTQRARTVAWFVHEVEAQDYVQMVATDRLNTQFDYRIVTENGSEDMTDTVKTKNVQLARLHTARCAAEYGSVEMRALDVAIGAHIGATFTLDDAAAALKIALALTGK